MKVDDGFQAAHAVQVPPAAVAVSIHWILFCGVVPAGHDGAASAATTFNPEMLTVSEGAVGVGTG